MRASRCRRSTSAPCSDEAENFVSFMTSSAGGCAGADDALQIMYGIAGEHDLTERTLEHLRGWRDSAPVRVGNGAWNQTQLDVYGQLLDAIHLYHEQLGELHPEIQRFVAELADAAAGRWMEKDQGMWEMRGDPRHHLSSKVLCWTALDRAVKLAPALDQHAKGEEWTAERDRIREAILTRGWSDAKQAYAQSFDSDELDAAQLLMPLVGFLPATDERMRSTIEVIAEELTRDGLVLRYLNNDGLNADGLTGEEGTFTICSFWLASALAKAGELERAEALFDQLAGYANDLGLLAEEIDVASGEQLGNFPAGLQSHRVDHRGVGDRQGPRRLVGQEPVEDVAHVGQRATVVEALGRLRRSWSVSCSKSAAIPPASPAKRDLRSGDVERAGRLEEAEDARRLRPAVDLHHHPDELDAGELADVHVVVVEELVDVGAEHLEGP